MKLPYVNLTRAATWVCLDCGYKNCTEFVMLEDPEQIEAIRHQINASEEDEIFGIPHTVSCVKCDKMYRTAEDVQVESVLESLLAALRALENDNQDIFDVGMNNLIDNVPAYVKALEEVLAEEGDEAEDADE